MVLPVVNSCAGIFRVEGSVFWRRSIAKISFFCRNRKVAFFKTAYQCLAFFLIFLLSNNSAEIIKSSPIRNDTTGLKIVFSQQSDHLVVKSLSAYLRGVKINQALAARFFLDSLGFFNASIDTSIHNILCINIGQRTVICSISVRSPVAISIDSITTLHFPIPYDASIVSLTARKILLHLASRGYPFPTISTTFRRPNAVDKNSIDSITVEFLVEPDRYCVFGEPAFRGTFSTSIALLRKDILFAVGEPFDIRKIEHSVQRLRSRPYLETVAEGAPQLICDEAVSEASLLSSMLSSSPDTSAVSVMFYIVDKSGMGIDGGVAYQSEDNENNLIGQVKFSLLNLFHRGESVFLSYEGKKFSQLFDLTLGMPFVAAIPLFCVASGGIEIEQNSYGYIHGDLKNLIEPRTLWKTGIGIKAHAYQPAVPALKTESKKYYEGYLIAMRQRQVFRAAVASNDLFVKCGTGIAQAKSKNYNRWNLEISTGTHIPLGRKFAFAGRIENKNLFTDEDSLPRVELYRIGGSRSLRGYSEKAFAFPIVAYFQTDILFYFTEYASAYIFTDAGAGLSSSLKKSLLDNVTPLMGYGIGLRLPLRAATMRLEWARNYTDTRNLGRIHIGIKNNFYTENLW